MPPEVLAYWDWLGEGEAGGTMRKQAGKTRQESKANGNGHPPKKERLPSIDLLIRKICRKDIVVGLVVKK